LHHQPHLLPTCPVVEIAIWHQPVVWLRTHRRERKVTVLWLCFVVCEAPKLLMRSHGSTCCPFCYSHLRVFSSVRQGSCRWCAQPSCWAAGEPLRRTWPQWHCAHRIPRTRASEN
jgi:hypothetical protein